jgi:hypothetical protein
MRGVDLPRFTTVKMLGRIISDQQFISACGPLLTDY